MTGSPSGSASSSSSRTQTSDAAVGVGELGQREDLADAAAQRREHHVDLGDQLVVPPPVEPARLVDPTPAVVPLLARDFELHGQGVQQLAGHTEGSSARIRSPSS